MRIHFVTTNRGKMQEALCVFKRIAPQIELVYAPIESIIEPQGSPEEIALYKVRQAFEQLESPCFIDDVSLHFPSIGNLPGPYIRQFLESLGVDGLFELVAKYENLQFFVLCTIGYAFSKEAPPIVFQARLDAVACPPRGSTHHGPLSWNSIAYLPEYDKTLAELSFEEISRISARKRALEQLITYIKTT